eukprot:167670_1
MCLSWWIMYGVSVIFLKIEEEEAKQANAASKKDDEDQKEPEMADEYSKELGDIFKDDKKDDEDQKEPEMADEYSKELGDIFKDDNKGGMKAPVKVVAVQT